MGARRLRYQIGCVGDKVQGAIRREPHGEWVELINGVWMGQGSLSQIRMGCSQAPVSSRAGRKGSLSLLECFCVSVCFLPELYVWPSAHVCITPSCLIGPTLGSGPGPWHLACWAHRLIFLQTLSKPRSPSFTALWQPAGRLNELGTPSLVPPSMARSLFCLQRWAALCQCPTSGLSPPLNSFQCLNSFCLYV